jgi:glucose/mannose-6-phosphate isomerase
MTFKIKMADFDYIKKIREIDKSDMLDILLGLPGQCRQAIDIAKGFKPPGGYNAKDFDRIFFTGMGGSAIGADIIRTYVSAELDRPVMVNRNYGVPASVNDKTLCFVSSYSGDTEETLSAYSQIKAKGAKIIAITSGGKLGAFVLKDKMPCILIPKGIPPRTAVGYMTLIPLILLSRMGFIKNQDAHLKELIDVISALKENVLQPSVPAPKNIAKDVALKIRGRFVIIYGAQDFLAGVVTRCRQEFQENSKILCASAVLPEMNHNEITGWEDPGRISKDFAIIILRDKDEHPNVTKRIQITKELIARRTTHISEIKSVGKSLLARTFSLIYIGTFISFYLAMVNGIDPTPVNNVTYLKRQLAKRE